MDELALEMLAGDQNSSCCKVPRVLENAKTCIDSEGGQIDFLVNRVKAVRVIMLKHGASQSSTNSTRTTSPWLHL